MMKYLYSHRAFTTKKGAFILLLLIAASKVIRFGVCVGVAPKSPSCPGTILSVLKVAYDIEKSTERERMHRISFNVVKYFLFSFTECDGIFLSNGPGDPQFCAETIENLRKLLQVAKHKPIFGICLGHQLLSIAAGASTYKMK